MKIVRYTASWCGPCKMYAPVFDMVAGELGLETAVLDVDENPDAGVLGVPTTQLIAGDGSVLASRTGAMSPANLREWIAENRA